VDRLERVAIPSAGAGGWSLAAAPVIRRGTGDFTTNVAVFGTIAHAAGADLIDFVVVPDLLTGVLVKCRLVGQCSQTAANMLAFDFEVDRPVSANVNVGDGHDQGIIAITHTARHNLAAEGLYVVTEDGDHGFRPLWKVGAGVATLGNAAAGNGDNPLVFTVETHPAP
jgi:hypothetical protein